VALRAVQIIEVVAEAVSAEVLMVAGKVTVTPEGMAVTLKIRLVAEVAMSFATPL